MGNYRFRVSDMMPSSWFCKLKDIGRANRSQSIHHTLKKSQTPAATTASAAALPPMQQPKKQDYFPKRASHYIPSKKRTEKLPRSPINTKASDTHFPVESPRKSNRRTRRKATKPCVSVVSSASCNCSRNLISENPAHDDDNHLCRPIIASSSEFDSCHVSSNMFKEFEDLEVASELKLPPILTKPVKKEVHKSALHYTSVPKEHNKTAARRSVSGIHGNGIKVRQSSPRVGSRKAQACRNQNGAAPRVAVQQRAPSENLVVIKSSSNPMREFMESMVEMIVENNIREPKDLEELLACYLSMNSKEYHDVIIKVFERIWFVLTDARMSLNS